MAVSLGPQETVPTRDLVWSMVRDDGSLPAHELYDVAEACGYSVDQVRLCIARLVQEGDFTQTGRGRRAVLQATRKAEAIGEPELDYLALGFRQDAGRAPWDGRWHLASFSIEESRRAARGELRAALRWSGAPVAGGVYVSAHAWEDRIARVAEDLDVRSSVMLATVERLDVGGESDPMDVAAALWPLPAIAGRWERFNATYGPTIDDLHPDGELLDRVTFIATLLNMTNDFRYCLSRDPLLPPELLPPGWPARRAREIALKTDRVFRRQRDEAGLPALQRRYDAVFDEFTDPPAKRTRRR